MKSNFLKSLSFGVIGLTLGISSVAFSQATFPPGAGGIGSLVEDTTPQLGGNLDLNGNTITGMVIGTDIQAYDDGLTALATTAPLADKIPYWTSTTTASSLSLLDEDTMVSNSATGLATQQSIKAYVDSQVASSGHTLLDEDDFASNSAVSGASQQSIKAYVDNAVAGAGGGSNFFDDDGTTPTTGNASATGTDAVAIGDDALASAVDSLAIGSHSDATTNGGAVAIGRSALATGLNSLAIGSHATNRTTASNTQTIAIGSVTTATAAGATAMGLGADVSAGYGLGLGYLSTVSGTNGTAIGYDSTATALNATALGKEADATSEGSVAIGELAVASTGVDAIAIGTSSAASAQESIAIGNGAAASASRTVAMGDNASASATYGTAVGQASVASNLEATAYGSYALAQGEESTAIGRGTEATVDFSAAIGSNVISNETGKLALGVIDGNATFGRGEVQKGIHILYGETTNATPTEIFLANISNARLNIPTDSVYYFEARIVARRSDADDESASYVRRGVIDNNTGTVALVGSLDAVYTNEDTAAWDVAIAADNTNKSLNVTVTGETSKTIKWNAIVETTELVE